MTESDRLAKIQARTENCASYYFGMRDADQLAHHDVPWLLEQLQASQDALSRLRDMATKPLEPDTHDVDWWRRTASFWAGQDEQHERERDAALAEVALRDDAIAKAEKELLGGIGQSWSRLVDRVILILRSTKVDQ